MKNIFVYGTLKRGFRLNPVITGGGGKLVSERAILPNFMLMTHGPFPAALPASKHNEIVGEVWACSKKVEDELDWIEGSAMYTPVYSYVTDEAAGDRLKAKFYIQTGFNYQFEGPCHNRWEWVLPNVVSVSQTPRKET